MKKLVLAFLLGIIPFKLHASITDPEVLQEKTVVVHFSTTVPAGATSAFDLISLSTTANLFPHKERGEIDVSEIRVVYDKLAASTGTVKIGVVNFVNTSTGSVSFFYVNSSQKEVTSSLTPFFLENFSPAFYRCYVRSGKTATNTDVDGITPFILTNDKDTGSSLYRSTATASLQLPSPIGTTVAPAVGDIVMKITNLDSTNSVVVIADIWYHSEP